jgi:hypothetical protein
MGSPMNRSGLLSIPQPHLCLPAESISGAVKIASMFIKMNV